MIATSTKQLRRLCSHRSLNHFLMIALISTCVQASNSSSFNASYSASGCTPQATKNPHNGTYEIGSGAGDNSTRCNTLFGVAYEVWWKTIVNWTSPEAMPVLGEYSSLNSSVITQHAELISDAGIDFILVDLSNSDSNIALSALDELVKVYATLDKHPQIAILLGTGTNGTLDSKADLIYNRYVGNSSYSSLFLQYKGKPLLTFFTGASFIAPPNYTNPKFTVRFVGAFQEITLNPGGEWSFTNRKPIVDGPLTNVTDFNQTGLSEWSADPAWHLTDGYYASTEAVNNGTQETGNITSNTFTVTENVIQFNAIGTDPAAQAGLGEFGLRNIFLLKDATTGTILRSASPPGSITTFFIRQWNVRDLVGREVVFEVVSNAGTSVAPTLGWTGFYGLAQVENEYMVVPAQTGGNEFYGSDDDWDAHMRYYGGTLIYNMAAVFNYEPDVALLLQWNEFGSPDQYGVEASNDMEPTTITKLAGADSDGWGDYYLNLTTELIQQYRLGNLFPSVLLDTRYP